MKTIIRLLQAADMAVYTWKVRRRFRRIIIEGRETRPPLPEDLFNKSHLE